MKKSIETRRDELDEIAQRLEPYKDVVLEAPSGPRILMTGIEMDSKGHVIGYSQETLSKVGYFWAPYIPLFTCPTSKLISKGSMAKKVTV